MQGKSKLHSTNTKTRWGKGTPHITEETLNFPQTLDIPTHVWVAAQVMRIYKRDLEGKSWHIFDKSWNMIFMQVCKVSTTSSFAMTWIHYKSMLLVTLLFSIRDPQYFAMTWIRCLKKAGYLHRRKGRRPQHSTTLQRWSNESYTPLIFVAILQLWVRGLFSAWRSLP